MSLSVEASCNGCERYLHICYQQIYRVAYLCQSLLELGPSSIGLKLGCYSYKSDYYDTILIEYDYYSNKCDGEIGI